LAILDQIRLSGEVCVRETSNKYNGIAFRWT
jgi:hypothetical protein